MNMKIIMPILCLFISTSLFGQDIVYDSIYGNKSNWIRIKGGPSEKTLKIQYENIAQLAQSKILTSIGSIEHLELNVDYKDYYFGYDTLTYEFETDVPINVIVFKYHVTESLIYYYVGLRKSSPGAGMFEGQYMFVAPVVANGCEVKIFNGIGSNRQLFLDLRQAQISDMDINDYTLTNRVTVQGINVSRTLRSSKTRDTLTEIDDGQNYNIEYWPNPILNTFTLRITQNPGVLVQIFNISPLLVYEKFISSDETIIDASSFLPGVYMVVIIDSSTGIIIDVIKIIKR